MSWVQPPPAGSDYVVELITQEGAPQGQASWRGLALEKNLNGGAILTCSIDNDDQVAAHVRLGDRALRLWEKGVLRFQGKLREPLVYRPGKIELTAGSPYTLLDRRQIQRSYSFTQVNQSEIIRRVLADQEARSSHRLRMAAFQPSVLRDREYEEGKSVQELIAQLAGVINGPLLRRGADPSPTTRRGSPTTPSCARAIPLPALIAPARASSTGKARSPTWTTTR